jgi:hypothetical protein
MNVKNIEMLRDGGSILFELQGSKADGYFKLESPLHSKPRKLIKNARAIELGSDEEQIICQELINWIGFVVTDSIRSKMNKLKEIEWRNLPDALQEAIPYFRIEAVINVLSQRKKT